MRESDIRKKAIDKLKSEGWICWYPFKSKWAKESDIFGCFDLVAISSFSSPIFIQLTSLPNIRAREKKVRLFMDRNKLYSLAWEVWGYDKRKKDFKIISCEVTKRPQYL